MFPETALDVKSTRMELVPEPEAMVAPAGIVHKYETELGTGATEYTIPSEPEQTDEMPFIVPGFPGTVFITIETIFEVAGLPEVHIRLEVITT